MSEPLTIALDAMGGDDAPEIVLRGAQELVDGHLGVVVLFLPPSVQSG